MIPVSLSFATTMQTVAMQAISPYREVAILQSVEMRKATMAVYSCAS